MDSVVWIVEQCVWVCPNGERCEVKYHAATSDRMIAAAHMLGAGWRPSPWGGYVCPGHA